METDDQNLGSDATAKQDEKAILEVIEQFAEGIRKLDPHLVSSVFHPKALSFSITPRGICIEPVEAWPEILRKAREDSDHLFREKFSVQTLNIDIAGTAASAKVEWEFESSKIIDFYNLLEMESGWLITNQVYDTSPLSKVD
ncbi:MAG TPA: nuclear transport factor 2 family protein [Acidobacteriota bacterium]|nr:nuclear transport factor 2 family protein [Acidobacteriota bacterium]